MESAGGKHLESEATPQSAEQAADGNRERYRSIFQCARDAVLVLDGDRCVECNPSALEMFGVKAEEIVGSTLGDLSPERQPDGRPSADAARERADAALAGESQFFEWSCLRKDGSALDTEVSLSRCAVGGRFLLQATVRDVTARKQAERALSEEKDLCQRLVHLSPTFVVAIDSDLRTVLANDTMLAALGYRADEVVGEEYLTTFVPESERPALEGHFRQVLAGRRVPMFENHVLTRDGRAILCEWHTIPVFSGGRYHFFMGSGIDVTEARRVAREREQLQGQLMHAQKMECVGRVVAGVAHDFNNLLSVILGYTQLMARGVGTDAAMHADLAEVQQAGERAAALTRKLLAFSRQDVREPQLLDLNEVLVGVETLLVRVMGELVELDFVLAPDLGVVEADPGQIEQVVLNLVVNARDAMPEGGRLAIETANVDLDPDDAARLGGLRPGRHVTLAVHDTGSGMDRATMKRLFEPFFTTKPQGEGTGLGLSTVESIVRESGGRIEVHSEPGLGSTFRVYLPRSSDELAVAPAHRAPTPRLLGTETILIVEDDAAVRQVAARMLSAAGYTVVTAPNGSEALRTCERYAGDIHLLLTDVVMPRMSGGELAERLRKTRTGLRVMFMSGYREEVLGRGGPVELGATLIRKPLRESELVERVREALDGARGA